MKTFIINTAKGVVTKFKKHEVSGKLMGREWRMLSDDPNITGKYIFLKDGKLLISVNGLSTYSTWQIATESSIILDEGLATFLYKVIHIDENLVVLNLDGTDSFCFLINDASQSLVNANVENIQWYLYRNCRIDMLSDEQKCSRITPITSTPIPATGEKDDPGYTVLIIAVVDIMIIGLVLVMNLQ